MSYRVFPLAMATPILIHEPLAVGDTVGLHFHPWLGFGIFFASRVCEIIDETDASGVRWRGFKYQTLAGHPELGEERFLVSLAPDGEVEYHMISWSTQGVPFVRALAPLARWLQNRSNRLALENVASMLLARELQ